MRDQLIKEIDGYLKEEEAERDSIGFHLVRTIGKYLVKLKRIDTKEPRSTIAIHSTLSVIQEQLHYIEKQTTEKSTQKTYAAVAATCPPGENTLAPAKRPKNHDSVERAKINKEEAREKRAAKELTIWIGAENKRRKVHNTTTKDLLKVIQKQAKEMVEVSRLLSGNIKVYTRTQEAKEALQKEKNWVNIVALSASV